jgi:hypothetical protein
MRTLPLVLALLAPAAAHAGVGLGTTMGLGPAQVNISFDGNTVPTLSAGGFLPTLDLYFDKLKVQIHALETVDQLFNEEILLGANAYITAAQRPVSGSLDAVFAPGGGVDILGDPFTLALTGEAQVGVQTRGEAGIGVFVVPALGIGITDGDSDLIAGGTLQVSVWMGGAKGRETNDSLPPL